MRAGVEMTPLDEVLKPVSREVRVEAGGEYRLLGVRWYGEGLFLKETKSGQLIKADRLYRVRQGDFVYNRLFAWKGSFAVAGEKVNDCLCSHEFPCFVIAPERVDHRILLCYFRREAAWTEALALSSGATPTSRNRLKEKHLLAFKLPLPSLTEQRRAVERIEQSAGQIEVARKLRRESAEETASLLRSLLRGLSNKLRPAGRLADVLLRPPRNGWSLRCDNAEDGVPVLSLGAVTGFRYRSAEFKRTSLHVPKTGHFWLHPGDVLMTRSNTPELVGHVAIYDGSPTPCIY